MQPKLTRQQRPSGPAANTSIIDSHGARKVAKPLPRLWRFRREGNSIRDTPFSGSIGANAVRARLWFAFLVIMLCPAFAAAQDASVPAAAAAAPAQPSDKNAPELSSQETPTTFKVRVNLVEVRVVVRNAQGRAVGNLKQEDFQLLDNGKPQIISRFSVEQAGAKPPVIKEEASPEAPGPGPTLVLPKRYVAYLFDDIHLQFSDLALAKAAASRHLQTLQSTDRAAIFTTSGKVQLDFTDDRDKLIETLKRIMPSSMATTGHRLSGHQLLPGGHDSEPA